MSEKFEKVKQYYEKGYWTLKMVRNAVVKKWITEDEFKQITHTQYSTGEE